MPAHAATTGIARQSYACACHKKVIARRMYAAFLFCNYASRRLCLSDVIMSIRPTLIVIQYVPIKPFGNGGTNCKLYGCKRMCDVPDKECSGPANKHTWSKPCSERATLTEPTAREMSSAALHASSDAGGSPSGGSCTRAVAAKVRRSCWAVSSSAGCMPRRLAATDRSSQGPTTVRPAQRITPLLSYTAAT